MSASQTDAHYGEIRGEFEKASLKHQGTVLYLHITESFAKCVNLLHRRQIKDLVWLHQSYAYNLLPVKLFLCR